MAVRQFNLKLIRQKCVFILCSLLAIAMPFCIYSMFLSAHSSRQIIQSENKNFQTKSSRIVVLFWTSYYQDIEFVGFDAEKYWFWKKDPDRYRITDNVYDGPFNRCENPVARKCLLTNNRSFLTHSSAVMFHIRDLHLGFDMPWYRSPKQRWIFYNHESPVWTRQPFNQMLQSLPNLPDHYRFNWTMTYRLDSDIVAPYSPRIGEYRRRLSVEKKLTQALPGLIARKTKLVAWMASNCFSTERRRYVDELKKYINVDIYGGCGPLKCYNNKTHPYACNEMLERDYKFYLAFENSKCLDYVTEKFYNALLFSIVPVVYGGADYNAIGAPKNSYIDVRIFQSPRHLANYLLFLDENEDAYRRYFDWRFSSPGLATLRRREPWCDLCEKLANDVENNKGNVQNSKSYKDIYSWWFNSKHCV